MVQVIINPGSGPVADASESHAIENIKHYMTDGGLEGFDWIRIPTKDYGEGRFAFLIWKDRHCVEVQIPGIPLAQVRFVNDPGQNIWDFPRLYVDGSSWVWKYAIRGPEDFNCDEE